jgi:hypothetical protein
MKNQRREEKERGYRRAELVLATMVTAATRLGRVAHTVNEAQRWWHRRLVEFTVSYGDKDLDSDALFVANF